MEKSANAFRTISEAAKELDVPQHVLRFWETKFKQIKPMKRGGGRRFYRPQDVDLIKGIKYFLYQQGYTIKGVQKILSAKGVAYVANVWKDVNDPNAANLDLNDNKAPTPMTAPKNENDQAQNASKEAEQLEMMPTKMDEKINEISNMVAEMSDTEHDIYKRAQQRFNQEKDAKVQNILTELSEIKNLLKNNKAG